MELRQLEYFIAVANEMSFSRAAQRIHIVQSALSVSISKLEKEFGVELFDRSKQQIRITPAGELFRDHARQVLRAARMTKDALNDHRGKLTGTVEFGSLVSFGRLDVPKVLGEFHRHHPLVRIRLHQAPFGSKAYLSSIADGSLDLALISAPDRFPSDLDMQPLSQEEMVFVCPPDHEVAGQESVRMADLAAEELIQFPVEYGLRRLIDEAFIAAEVEPHVAYEISTEYLVAAQLVRHGLGTTFMPVSEAGRFTDLRAVPIRPAVVWKIYLASSRPESGSLGPATARLAEALLSEADADKR
jgi:DNA-binding transcriptional LysR family regulator